MGSGPDGMHHWAIESEEGQWLTDCDVELVIPGSCSHGKSSGRCGPPTSRSASAVVRRESMPDGSLAALNPTDSPKGGV